MANVADNRELNANTITDERNEQCIRLRKEHIYEFLEQCFLMENIELIITYYNDLFDALIRNIAPDYLKNKIILFKHLFNVFYFLSKNQNTVTDISSLLMDFQNIHLKIHKASAWSNHPADSIVRYTNASKTFQMYLQDFANVIRKSECRIWDIDTNDDDSIKEKKTKFIKNVLTLGLALIRANQIPYQFGRNNVLRVNNFDINVDSLIRFFEKLDYDGSNISHLITQIISNNMTCYPWTFAIILSAIIKYITRNQVNNFQITFTQYISISNYIINQIGLWGTWIDNNLPRDQYDQNLLLLDLMKGDPHRTGLMHYFSFMYRLTEFVDFQSFTQCEFEQFTRTLNDISSLEENEIKMCQNLFNVSEDIVGEKYSLFLQNKFRENLIIHVLINLSFNANNENDEHILNVLPNKLNDNQNTDRVARVHDNFHILTLSDFDNNSSRYTILKIILEFRNNPDQISNTLLNLGSSAITVIKNFKISEEKFVFFSQWFTFLDLKAETEKRLFPSTFDEENYNRLIKCKQVIHKIYYSNLDHEEKLKISNYISKLKEISITHELRNELVALQLSLNTLKKMLNKEDRLIEARELIKVILEKNYTNIYEKINFHFNILNGDVDDFLCIDSQIMNIEGFKRLFPILELTHKNRIDIQIHKDIKESVLIRKTPFLLSVNTILNNAIEACIEQEIVNIFIIFTRTDNTIIIKILNNGPHLPSNINKIMSGEDVNNVKLGITRGNGLYINNKILNTVGGKIVPIIESSYPGFHIEMIIEREGIENDI